jgi:hypothetical protein
VVSHIIPELCVWGSLSSSLSRAMERIRRRIGSLAFLIESHALALLMTRWGWTVVRREG